MSSKKYQPERTCAGCRQKFPQKDLLAIKRLKNGLVSIDFEQKLSGRGVYLCKNKKCFLKTRKRKGHDALSMSLKVNIPEEVLNKLETIVIVNESLK